jgi:homoserine kinase
MNNASIKQPNKASDDKLVWLRRRQTQLSSIIDAAEHISQSSYWAVLKDEVFEGVRKSLVSKLKEEKDEKELYRLQGQFVWVDKYCDLDKLAEVYRKELLLVTQELNG